MPPLITFKIWHIFCILLWAFTGQLYIAYLGTIDNIVLILNIFSFLLGSTFNLEGAVISVNNWSNLDSIRLALCLTKMFQNYETPYKQKALYALNDLLIN